MHGGVLEVDATVDTVLVVLYPKGSLVPRAGAACEVIHEVLAPNLPVLLVEGDGPELLLGKQCHRLTEVKSLHLARGFCDAASGA